VKRASAAAFERRQFVAAARGYRRRARKFLGEAATIGEAQVAALESSNPV